MPILGMVDARRSLDKDTNVAAAAQTASLRAVKATAGFLLLGVVHEQVGVSRLASLLLRITTR